MSGRYDGMTHADLMALRNSLAPTDPRQQQIAPYEHAAYAREWTQQNPLTAIPSLTVAIPAYALAKQFGLIGARTRPSFEQVAMGYRGMGQGIAKLLDM